MQEVASRDQYNAALEHPVVGATVRYLTRRGSAMRPTALVDRIARLASFPEISIGALLDAARGAGGALRGVALDFAEIEPAVLPLLAYVRRGLDADAPLDLVQVERVGRTQVVISSDRFGVVRLPRADLERRWSGVVLLADERAAPVTAANDELEAYREQVTVIPDLLSRDDCRALIAYGEAVCFRRSRVGQRRGRIRDDVVSAKVRSSSSAVLPDRDHPILARLYAECAQREGVDPAHVEQIQCVRYRKGQRFRAHFDGGLDLPRLTTYLVYLNDDFTGGETYFPALQRLVKPRAGHCLRFPSCDRQGRVLWPSEHGGLPVSQGTKYALNIWVRCPDAAAPLP